eukprot:GHVS01084320.1.p1 GENE.GHVS01084320.1~~GHVS01084320.1.p1  ORF type:complete len:100 (+),score=3.06 GHVS01084320.1:1-300(+)
MPPPVYKKLHIACSELCSWGSTSSSSLPSQMTGSTFGLRDPVFALVRVLDAPLVASGSNNQFCHLVDADRSMSSPCTESCSTMVEHPPCIWTLASRNPN